MTAGALLTYVWHYLVARTIYDELLRPAIHGHLGGVALICAVAVVAFLLGVSAGRGRSGRRHPSSRRGRA